MDQFQAVTLHEIIPGVTSQKLVRVDIVKRIPIRWDRFPRQPDREVVVQEWSQGVLVRWKNRQWGVNRWSAYKTAYNMIDIWSSMLPLSYARIELP